ncbi:hypothetical protein I4U23_020173 [Adineta vaga]|nr:hypothetical protein I4U23_020173 [Adineta vaga]
MQHFPSVKVTKIKKHRSNTYRTVKSTSSNVNVSRVKSVASNFKLSKKEDQTLVVENVDPISTTNEKPLSSTLINQGERPLTTVSITHISRVQSIKNIPDIPSENVSKTNQSKLHTFLALQNDINHYSCSARSHQSHFTSNISSNPGSPSLLIGDYRKIYTIGEKKHQTNQKLPWYKKCTLRYLLGIGLVLLLICGIVIAVPIAIVSTKTTTTTTAMMSTTSVSVTTSTASTTSVSVTTSTASTTSVSVTTSTVSTTSVSVTTSTIGSTTTATSTTTAATVTITSNLCTSTWNALTMIYHCDNCSPQLTWHQLTFNYVAIANLTRIIFALRRDLGYFGLDDVSIRNTAALGVEILTNGGFESGTLSSWSLCVQSGSTGTGSVQSTANSISYGSLTFAALSGSYYYLGGATVNAEYLTQTFPSVIGNTYKFSFSYVYSGSGLLSSGDFLLSI